MVRFGTFVPPITTDGQLGRPGLIRRWRRAITELSLNVNMPAVRKVPAMANVCPQPCFHDDEVQRIIGELTILLDFVRVQLSLIVPTGVNV